MKKILQEDLNLIKNLEIIKEDFPKLLRVKIGFYFIKLLETYKKQTGVYPVKDSEEKINILRKKLEEGYNKEFLKDYIRHFISLIGDIHKKFKDVLHNKDIQRFLINLSKSIINFYIKYFQLPINIKNYIQLDVIESIQNNIIPLLKGNFKNNQVLYDWEIITNRIPEIIKKLKNTSEGNPNGIMLAKQAFAAIYCIFSNPVLKKKLFKIDMPSEDVYKYRLKNLYEEMKSILGNDASLLDNCNNFYTKDLNFIGKFLSKNPDLKTFGDFWLLIHKLNRKFAEKYKKFFKEVFDTRQKTLTLSILILKAVKEVYF